jgi:hypothetical protein
LPIEGLERHYGLKLYKGLYSQRSPLVFRLGVMSERREDAERAQAFRTRYKELRGMEMEKQLDNTQYAPETPRLGEALDSSVVRHCDGYSGIQQIIIRSGYQHLFVRNHDDR